MSAWARTEICVASLSAQNVPEKLLKAGVGVYSVRESGKNAITLEVRSKDLEKVFAILRGSCYNIVKTRPRGLSLLYKKTRSALGLLIGAALFALTVAGAQTRVLAVEVVGSGAYYEPEVLQTLSRGGVKRFGGMPKNTALLTAELLSLPRVSYCEIRHSGGILTVEVEVSDESAQKSCVPLRAPASGRVEELIVVRGTPKVSVGDEVKAGEIVVDALALYGEETRAAIVIARVTIGYEVRAVFAGSEEQARAEAYLAYGEIEDLKSERTADGWLITGRAFAESALNL